MKNKKLSLSSETSKALAKKALIDLGDLKANGAGQIKVYDGESVFILKFFNSDEFGIILNHIATGKLLIVL